VGFLQKFSQKNSLAEQIPENTWQFFWDFWGHFCLL